MQETQENKNKEVKDWKKKTTRESIQKKEEKKSDKKEIIQRSEKCK